MKSLSISNYGAGNDLARSRRRRMLGIPITNVGFGSSSSGVDLSGLGEQYFEKMKDANGKEYIMTSYPIATLEGLTMFADPGNLDLPSIYDGIPLGDGLQWLDGKIVATGGGGGGTMDHNDLLNRNAADQHAIAAISGLQSALDGKSPVHSHPYRPDTWMPTAAQVGALSVNGKAADSSKLGGVVDSRFFKDHGSINQSNITTATSTGCYNVVNGTDMYRMLVSFNNQSGTHSNILQLWTGYGENNLKYRMFNASTTDDWKTIYHSQNSNGAIFDWTCKDNNVDGFVYFPNYGRGIYCKQYGIKPIVNTGYQEHYYGDWTRLATAGSANPMNLIIGSSGVALWDGNKFFIGNSTVGFENAGTSMFGVSSGVRTFGWSNTIFETYKNVNVLAKRLVIGETGYGVSGAPKYYDLAFRGYYGGDYVRLRSHEISGTSAEGLLELQVRGYLGGSTGEPQTVVTFDASRSSIFYGLIKNYDKAYIGAHDNYGFTPAITLALGDHDTGFQWENDGYIRGVGNGVNCWGWTGGEFQTHKRTVIGAGTDVELVTRHISGKHYQNDSDSDLYINWRSGLPAHTGGNMSIGGQNATCNATLHVHGNILADGGITMLSDMRLKNRISNVKSVLPSISGIDVFRYTLKADNIQRVYIGVSAQQIQGIWSEFVHGVETLSLDYAQMAAYVAIKGLQETKLWMDRKDKKIAELEKRIVELEKNVA